MCVGIGGQPPPEAHNRIRNALEAPTPPPDTHNCNVLVAPMHCIEEGAITTGKAILKKRKGDREVK
jgi:hypothetical protein